MKKTIKRFTPDFFDEEYFEGGTKSLYGKEFPDKTFSSYSEEAYYPRGKELASMYNQIHILKPDSVVLFIGCAKGFHVGAFRDLGYEAWGMDISHYALHASRKQDRGVLIQADVIEEPYKSETFDVLGAFDVLEHVPKKYLARAISETIRIVKIGGIIDLQVPYSEDSPGVHNKDDKSHVSIYQKQYWENKFSRHCRLLWRGSDKDNCRWFWRKFK